MIAHLIVGLWIYSICYNYDGTERNTRMIAGANVQATSIIWPSSIYQLEYLLNASVIIM
jgi:hypothetical protein